MGRVVGRTGRLDDEVEEDVDDGARVSCLAGYGCFPSGRPGKDEAELEEEDEGDEGVDGGVGGGDGGEG